MRRSEAVARPESHMLHDMRRLRLVLIIQHIAIPGSELKLTRHDRGARHIDD